MAEQLRDIGAVRFIRRDQDFLPAPMNLNIEIPAHLHPVVRELVLGTVDATACRRLNVSPRTFSRRVAELLEHLGVESRFQAGMQIMLRQLLPDTWQPRRADVDAQAASLKAGSLSGKVVDRPSRARDWVNGIG
jgi:hypothetical protein